METLNVNLVCVCFFFFFTEKVKLNVGELFCVGTRVEPGIPNLALSSHPPICACQCPYRQQKGPGQESWHRKSTGWGSYRPSEGQCQRVRGKLMGAGGCSTGFGEGRGRWQLCA